MDSGANNGSCTLPDEPKVKRVDPVATTSPDVYNEEMTVGNGAGPYYKRNSIAAMPSAANKKVNDRHSSRPGQTSMSQFDVDNDQANEGGFDPE